MKKSFAVVFGAIAIALGVLASGQKAYAIPFADSIDFGGLFVADTANFAWNHDINDNLGGNSISNVSINSASLSVRYARTNGSGSSIEHWTLFDLGDLLRTGTTPITTLFTPGSVIMGLLETSGVLPVTVLESTFDYPESRPHD